MLSTKSILARLLSNENITVVQGNFQTASFNVESRVLQLPLWRNMSNDLYDLLVGHEVGHALYTPKENLAIKGVPFSFVNVVEDIRIEKHILRQYPGLVSNFSRGYLDLLKMNIFGTEGKDLNELPFMDRLNLKSKGRNHVDVSFTDEEQYYFNRAMSVETFEDVREVCLELVEWLRAQQSEENEDRPLQTVSEDMSDDDSEGMMMGDQPEDGEPSPSPESGEESEESEDGEGVPSASEESEEGEESEKAAPGASETDDAEKSEETAESEQPETAMNGKDEGPEKSDGAPLSQVATDIAQHQNKAVLLDTESFMIQNITREEYKNALVDYKTLLEARQKDILPSFYENEAYEDFMRESKPLVNLMVKEFEMRKAAYRNLRARTSTKGSLDVNKLHAYKYDDHIFKQVTTLADGKNHGMIMLIDYSGSMNEVLPSVIKQTMNLVHFCKRVNIPFQVFAFTTTCDYVRPPQGACTTFDLDSLSLIELFNSDMSKREYEYAMRSMFARTMHHYGCAGLEGLGSTPLNGALLCMQYVFEDFQKRHNVHKLNFVTLTDGDSNGAQFRYGADYDSQSFREKTSYITVKGKRIQFPSYYSNSVEQQKFTREILNTVCGPNISKINFFVASGSQVWGLALRDVIGHGNAQYRNDVSSVARQVKKIARSEGVFVNDNSEASGYDRQFILLQRTVGRRFNRQTVLVDDVEEMDIPENATAAKIAKAFSKQGEAKKKSRIVTRKFAEMVA